MGDYRRSGSFHGELPVLEEKILSLNVELFGSEFRVLRVEGVPVSPGDDRRAKWAFLRTAPESAGSDAVFAFSLLQDGVLEWKIPWHHGEQAVAAQDRLRRTLTVYS